MKRSIVTSDVLHAAVELATEGKRQCSDNRQHRTELALRSAGPASVNGGASPSPAKELPSEVALSTSSMDTDVCSLHQAFDHLAQQHADRPAVEDEQGTMWTYAQLHAASLRMAVPGRR